MSRKEFCFNCGDEFYVESVKVKSPKNRTYNADHDLYCKKCRDKCGAKDMYILTHLSDDNLINLAVAVLRQASNDYKRAVAKWRKAYTPDSKRYAFNAVKSELKWWKSNGFKFWGFELDGPKIIGMLNKSIYDDIRMYGFIKED